MLFAREDCVEAAWADRRAGARRRHAGALVRAPVVGSARSGGARRRRRRLAQSAARDGLAAPQAHRRCPRRRRGVLTINGGSSSIKCAIFAAWRPAAAACCTRPWRRARRRRCSTGSRQQPEFASVGAVGHRRGARHAARRTGSSSPTVAARGPSRRFSPFVPEHLPGEIALIEAMRDRHPVAAAGRLLRHGVPPRHAEGRAS